jgi:hypothetical protein
MIRFGVARGNEWILFGRLLCLELEPGCVLQHIDIVEHDVGWTIGMDQTGEA